MMTPEQITVYGQMLALSLSAGVHLWQQLKIKKLTKQRNTLGQHTVTLAERLGLFARPTEALQNNPQAADAVTPIEQGRALYRDACVQTVGSADPVAVRRWYEAQVEKSRMQ